MPILPQMTVQHRYRGATRALLIGLAVVAGACSSSGHTAVTTSTAAPTSSTTSSGGAGSSSSAAASNSQLASDVAMQKAQEIQAAAEDSGVTVTDAQVQCMAAGILQAVGVDALVRLGVSGDPANLPTASLQAYQGAATNCVPPDAAIAAGLDTLDSTTS